MKALGLVFEQPPRLHAEGFGEGFEGRDVDTLNRVRGEDARGGGLRDARFSGEAVGRVPALARHVGFEVPSDHAANDSVSTASCAILSSELVFPSDIQRGGTTQTITGKGAFEQAKRKARYGHRDWLVWTDCAVGQIAAPRTAESIKAAMLATGSQRPFFMLHASDACPMR